MKVVYSETHRKHHRQEKKTPDVPERAESLLEAAKTAGHEIVEPPDYGPRPRALVHSPEYLHFLESAYERYQLTEGASEELVPSSVRPNSRTNGYPRAVPAQASYYFFWSGNFIGPGTWEAVCASANCAVHAAEELTAGTDAIYALCRPPGHHASADMGGALCYLNNAAIAAYHLRNQVGRVAILDIDAHHSNGTQALFYRRNDVLTVSLHGDPAECIPFFWGYESERGDEEGRGFNLNLPLTPGTDDEGYLEALQVALGRVHSFSPDALVVSLGFDAFEADPVGDLKVTTTGFGSIGQAVGALRLPTVLVQEGGYFIPALGENLERFLGAFEDAR